MKIYLAGSGRNLEEWSRTRHKLVALNHEVYDWTTGPSSYPWSGVGVYDVDATTPTLMQQAGQSDTVQRGIQTDLRFLSGADVFILLLPAGADAHFEMGYARAMRCPTAVYTTRNFLRASQFYGVADLVTQRWDALMAWLEGFEE